MTPEQRVAAADALVQESADAVRPYVRGSALVFEIATNVAVARR